MVMWLSALKVTALLAIFCVGDYFCKDEDAGRSVSGIQLMVCLTVSIAIRCSKEYKR